MVLGIIYSLFHVPTSDSYKNAAVISGKLNRHFTNDDPPVAEVKMLNNASAYPP